MKKGFLLSFILLIELLLNHFINLINTKGSGEKIGKCINTLKGLKQIPSSLVCGFKCLKFIYEKKSPFVLIHATRKIGLLMGKNQTIADLYRKKVLEIVSENELLYWIKLFSESSQEGAIRSMKSVLYSL